MSQRYVCPSMGSISRPLSQRAAMGFRCARGFHVSAHRLDDQPGDAAAQSKSLKDAMTGASVQRQPRRQRNVNAATQVGNLSFSRSPPADGTLAKRSPTAPPEGAKILTPRKPLVRREVTGPPGTMVRAPTSFRPRGGPNLRARGNGPPGANGPRGKGGERKPRKDGARAPRRGRGGGAADDAPQVDHHGIEAGSIERSTMQTLYRMQRNMWDRKAYEPKYAPGSFAANELIHAGRELFKGESPPVKVWGKLERTLNIVGMHGAASHLKVRRVPDGDAAPFGKEHENLLDSHKTGTAEQKAAA